MLRLLLELPLEAGELFSSFIDKESHGVHVQMDGQGVFLADFVPLELDAVILLVDLVESYRAKLQSDSEKSYLIFLVVPTTSKSVPLALNS